MVKLIHRILIVFILTSCGIVKAQNSSSIVLIFFEDGCLTERYVIPNISAYDEEARANVINQLPLFNDQFGSNCKVDGIDLNGEITDKTFPTLKLANDIAETINGKITYSRLWFRLNSNGGLISESMKIGDYISGKTYNTVVPSNAICLSACVLIYAAGDFRANLGKVGVHRPFSSEISTQNLEYTEYLKKYNDITKRMKAFLEKYGVSTRIVDLMNVVPSDDIKILTADERKELGLGLRNIAVLEFEKARKIEVCGNDFYQLQKEYQNFRDLCVGLRGLSEFDECDHLSNSTYPEYIEKVRTCAEMLKSIPDR